MRSSGLSTDRPLKRAGVASFSFYIIILYLRVLQKGTTIKELSRSLEDKLVFVPIPGIGRVKDGIEATLL